MSVRRAFSCNFCKNSISDASEGIGVKWTGIETLTPVYLHDAETHLCNPCCRALPTLFAELDSLRKSHAERDEIERAP